MTSPLTRPDDFDRVMADWMESDAHARAPEAMLGTVVERTRRTRRLSAWLLLERWIPRTFSIRLHAVPRVLPIVLLIALLVAAGLLALTIGSSRPLPRPFGPAANGSLAYDTKATIFVANQGATTVRPLIEGVANASSPTWSPDGTHIAFWGDDSPDSLFIADAYGSNVRKVTSQIWISTDKPPTWSPDGLFIAFSAESGPDKVDERLFVVEIATGAVTRVGPDGSIDVRSFFPSWSPDGDWIAFEAFRLAPVVRWGCGSSGPTASNNTGFRPAQPSSWPNRNGRRAPIRCASRTPPSMRPDRTETSTSLTSRPVSSQ